MSTAIPTTTSSKPLPIRHFPTPLSPSTTEDILITEPALRADNLVLETWASSSILASQLHLLPISFPAPSSSIIPILELGAGTGLVGIAAAAVYGRDAILTDLPPIVPGLEANIAINAELLSAVERQGGTQHFVNGSGQGAAERAAGERVEVQAGVLDWTRPEVCAVEGKEYSATETKAQLILAADTLYSEEHPVLLSQTVERWLRRDSTARFVMGTALRVAYLDEIRDLWDKLEGVGLVCVEEGKGMAKEEDFDDERLVEWSYWRWSDEKLRVEA
ncbi:Lysine methyltransferase-like protein 1 [Elsinoe fawcettii]|nr:Lysine methyltransferase-like protein 1 [Elsinoe fawcettii]